MKVLIDSDMGIDDISALMIMIPSTDVIGITTIQGNVDLQRATLNAQLINEWIDLNIFESRNRIPIYAGCDTPMVPLHSKICWEGHSDDGMGGFTSTDYYQKNFKSSLSPEPVQSEHAVNAMIRLSKEYPKELRLLALGPLTNIALAIKIDPGFLNRLHSMVVMGGSLYAQGNSNRAAEFNFHTDPEAAHIVFKAALESESFLIDMVPWETCVRHSFSWDFYDQLTSNSQNPKSQILKGITQLAESMLRKHQLDQEKHSYDLFQNQKNGFLLPDIYAALALIRPDSVISYKHWDVEVELHGHHSRGGLFYEWNGAGTSKSNAKVILDFDLNILQQQLLKYFQ